MKKSNVNEVLAQNLKIRMEAKGMKQEQLASVSKVGQTTISLYLSPERRKPGTSGKVPSAKIGEIEALADALGCRFLDLVTEGGHQASDGWPFGDVDKSRFDELSEKHKHYVEKALLDEITRIERLAQETHRKAA